MPLKIVPPRAGKTPNWYVRGTYLGVLVDRSTQSTEKRIAKQTLERIKRDIERGELAKPEEPTFLSAAVAYMKAGGDKRFLAQLIGHFKERTLVSIDQRAIDEAALTIYPTGTPATRNRQVYTPMSAILKHAGQEFNLKRPKGASGNTRTGWLWPEQAFQLFAAADEIDKRFGVFLRFLCYTGLRLSEALSLRWKDVRLDEGFAFSGKTKNGDPRSIHFPPHLVEDLRSLIDPDHPPKSGDRVFRLTKAGRVYTLMKMTRIAAGFESETDDPHTPKFPTFHTFRHTWASWMRRYANSDTAGLVATGAWRDKKSASRYEHAVSSEESRKADMLPTEPE